MTSAAELRDQMLNRRTSSATEAQAMRERNVDADMLDRERMTKGEAAPAATDVEEESPDDETDLAELTARRNWKKNLPEKDDVPKTESFDVQKMMIKDIVDAQIVDELHAAIARAPWYILRPTMRFMSAWDVVTTIALLFTAAVTPYEVTFLGSYPQGDMSWWAARS